MENEITSKKELATGMKVVLRNKEVYTVFANVHLETRTNNYDFVIVKDKDRKTIEDISMHSISSDNYNDNMTSKYNTSYDIVKIYGVDMVDEIFEKCIESDLDDLNTLLYKRAPKKMTKAEIEAALGYEVDIVEGE